MTDFLFLTSPRFAATVSALVQELEERGAASSSVSVIQPHHLILKAAEQARMIAAVLDDQCIDQLLYSAFFSGRNADMVLLDPGAPTNLPVIGALRRIPLGPTTSEALLALLRAPEADIGPIPTDKHEFLLWAAQHADRIGELSTTAFEQLISVLLWHAGLGYGLDARRGISSSLSDFSKRARVHIECKRFSRSSYVDLSIVRDVVSRALDLRRELVVLATNSPLTGSARAFIDTCVPPVWHIDLEAIQSLVRKVAKAETADPDNSELICPAWHGHEHYRRAGSVLDRLLVPGNHDLRWDWVTHGGISGFLPGRRAGARVLFVYFPATASRDDELTEEMRRVLGKIEAAGADIWHNCQFISVGHRCRGLQDYARAIRDSSAFWIFDRVDSQWSYEDVKALSWVASEFQKGDGPRPTVISDDSCRTRLRLPRCFSDGTFLDQADWINALTRITKQQVSAFKLGEQVHDETSG